MSVTLSMISGCQVATPVKANIETNANNSAGNTQVVKPVAPGATTGTNGNTLNPDNGSTDPNSGAATENDSSALDAAPVVHISAAAGGVYKSADGKLQAIFPPGALSQDADIRMVPVDTSKLKNTDVFLNGIRFQVDLGAAHLNQGTAVTVSSQVDDRMIGELKSMYTDYTPERYNLSQDNSGNWSVTMQLKGPAASLAANPPAVAGPGPTRGLMTEGTTPLLPTKGAATFYKGSKIEAFCGYAPPPLPATYGPEGIEVTYHSPTDPDIDGLPAITADGTDPYGCDVTVHLGTGTVNNFIGAEYSYQEIQPEIPAIPAVMADIFGNITNMPNTAPPGITVAQEQQEIRLQAYRDAQTGQFTGAVASRVSPNYTPGTPNQLVGRGLVNNAAQLHVPAVTIFAAYPGRAAVWDWVPVSQVDNSDTGGSTGSVTDTDATYTVAGHDCSSINDDNGGCIGTYVRTTTTVIDPAFFGGVSTVGFDAHDGIARFNALQSYDSRACAPGGQCAGGLVNFTITSVADYTKPAPRPGDYNLVQEHTNYPFQGESGVASQQTNVGDVPVLQLPKHNPKLYFKLNNPNQYPMGGGTALAGGLSGDVIIEGTSFDRAPDGAGHSSATGAISNEQPLKLWAGGITDTSNTYTFPPTNATFTDLAPVTVRPGDDGVHWLKITKIYTRDLQYVASPADLKNLQNVPIQRNGGYDLTTEMILNLAK